MTIADPRIRPLVALDRAAIEPMCAPIAGGAALGAVVAVDGGLVNTLLRVTTAQGADYALRVSSPDPTDAAWSARLELEIDLLRRLPSDSARSRRSRTCTVNSTPNIHDVTRSSDMPSATTAGVYMLANEHADAIQRFAADPALAVTLGIPQPPASTAGTDTVARLSAERLAGNSYWNAVVDQREVKGLSALIAPYTSEPTLVVWIDPAFRRRGYGELAIRLALEFAFRNLQLPLVHAAIDAADAAQTAALTKFGFAHADDSTSESPAERTLLRLTRSEWTAHRDRPAVARFHPSLRTILDAELAAGNEIAETGGGWPDPDSVFIRLRDPFRTKPTPLPSGVTYTEPNDPHWWKADYSSQSPRHILAC